MEKIGLSLENNYKLPQAQVLTLLRNVGFSAISPAWQKDVPLTQTAEAAARAGLCIQSLHAPYRGLPGMWQPETPELLPQLLRALDDCAACAIPVLVVHAWGGHTYTFREEALYFGHFDKLVDSACAKGVQIAFENLEGPEFLDALMVHYAGCSQVGLCWDSGHQLCYTPHRDFLSDYGDRLIMTHLNDNLGISHPGGQLQSTDDLHLLPYHGQADWSRNLMQLKQSKKQDILNFELKIRPKGDRCKLDLYSKIPLKQYFQQAYDSARQATISYFD